MQKDDHLLDQYLKNKVDEADFDFKEEYWLKASQMLDEEDGTRKKRPFFWRWFTSLCVLLVAGIGIFIFSNKHKQENKEKSVPLSQASGANTPGTSPQNGTMPVEISYNADQPLQKQTETAGSAAENHISKASTGRITPDVQNTENKKLSSTETNAVTGDEVNTSTGDVAAKSERRRKTVLNHLLPRRAQGLNEIKERKKQTALMNRNEKTADKTGKAKAAKAAKDAKDAEDEKAKSLALQSKQKTVQQQTVILNGKAMQAVDTQIYFQKQARDESVYNPRYHASLRNYVSERLDSVTILTFKPVPEPAGVTAPVAEIKQDTPEKKKNGLNLFVAGGGSFNKGFTGNTNTSVSWGISPYLSIGAEKAIGSRISIATQIGFTYFNALNVQKKVMNYKYSFGFDSTLLSVEYRRMYQLMLPVSIAYQLNKNHQVWTALGATYVLNTTSKVSDNGVSSFQNGYQGGINPFDLFAQLGYQYALNKHFGVQAFLQQGFISATKKDYFNINKPNTQTRISVGLKYYFKRNGN